MPLPRGAAFKAVLIISFQICSLLIITNQSSLSILFVNTDTNNLKTSSNQKWTFMIYLDGDNNLEDDMLGIFNGLEEAIDPSLVNVIVLFDRHEGYDDSNGDWSETRLYQISPDSKNDIINSNLLENWGEAQMDEPETLSRFIKYCLANFTADNYILDISDHGAGIFGICSDETSGPYQDLLVAEAKSAITNAITSYIDRFDIIFFHACNMAMLELVYEFKDLADYLVVSEELSYGPKEFSRMTLEELVENPSFSSLDFSKSIVNCYEKTMHTPKMKYQFDTTLSVIDTSKIDNVYQKFNYFVSNLSVVLEDGNQQEFFKIRLETQDFLNHCFADIIHLLENILESNLFKNFYEDLIDSTIALLDELVELIVYNYQDFNFAQNANGLSIFLPYPDYSQWRIPLEYYYFNNNNFIGMDWFQNTNYEELIYQMYFQDSDSDFLYDWFEKLYGLNPFYVDSDFDNELDSMEDFDQDGNWNFIEQLRGTNPLLSDTDKDGISDRDENGIYKPENSGANDYGYISTSPYDSDSDRDGWDDYREIFTYNTNPNDHTSQPILFRKWSRLAPIFGILVIGYILIVRSEDNEEKEIEQNNGKQEATYVNSVKLV